MFATMAAAAEPDFQGVWQIRGGTATLLPAGKLPSLMPAGLQAYQRNRAAMAAGDRHFDTVYRCASPGTPRIMLFPYPFEIIQQKDYILLSFEWNQLFRQVVLSNWRDTFTLPSAMGFSSGHWDGDTLVVVTTDRSAQTLLDDSGLPHSDKLQITERLRLKNNGRTLEDRLLISDPDTYREPWEAVVEFERRPQATIEEDVCLDRVKAGRPPIELPAARRKAGPAAPDWLPRKP
jgi:hypothetical protein